MSEMKRAYEAEHPREFAGAGQGKMSASEQAASADFEMWWAAVCREEAKILAEEGAYHVAGVYYADESDASKQRMWEAQRRVREQARQRVARQSAQAVA